MKQMTEMAWPRGEYHQEDVKHASEGKEKKRWLDNIRDDMNEYKMTK